MATSRIQIMVHKLNNNFTQKLKLVKREYELSKTGMRSEKQNEEEMIASQSIFVD